MAVNIIIPAHYQSHRLPGKILKEIAGKPMVQHVYERASQADADRVVIAADDKTVFDAAKNFGAEVYMTSDQHRSGTERASEIIEHLQIPADDIVMVLQGDEPLTPVSVLNQLIQFLSEHPDMPVATLCESIDTIEELFNPNITKVVLNKFGNAITFSRAPIPWNRDRFAAKVKQLSPDFTYYRHIGIYGYRASFVKKYITMTPSALEFVERLEQLRILYHGEKIHVEIIQGKMGPGVDTQADLDRVREILESSH